MPIQIPADLPARSALESENIFVMTDERAVRQDIRPLDIVIVNLMPTKIATETQLLRLLGNFCRLASALANNFFFFNKGCGAFFCPGDNRLRLFLCGVHNLGAVGNN